MRILLDECVPGTLARELVGHDVSTVQRMRWAGIKNGELLRRAVASFDAFLTVDRSIEFQQPLPAQLAIITLVARSNKLEDLRPLLDQVFRRSSRFVLGKPYASAKSVDLPALRHDNRKQEFVS